MNPIKKQEQFFHRQLLNGDFVYFFSSAVLVPVLGCSAIGLDKISLKKTSPL